MKHKENVFRTLARWFVRWIFGLKYEEKWFGLKKEEPKEIKFKDGVPDDSELIVSPGRQIFNRFIERKFAVFSVFVVLVMFAVVFIAPHFMTKYYDAFTETTQKDLPPTMDFMNVPSELAGNIKMIDSYSSFSVGLSNDGKVYVWGIGSIGATGIDIKQIPEEVKNAKIAFVAAGQDHIIAIGEDGKFYGWGSNRFGQYAVTDTIRNNPNLEPVPDVVLNGEIDVAHIKRVTCGYQASAILMDDGTLYIWGNKQTYANLDKFIGKTNIVDVDFTLSYVVGLDQKQTSVYTGTKGLFAKAKTKINTSETTSMSKFLDGRKINEIRATSSSVCLLLDDGSIALTGDFQSDVVDVPQLEDGEYFTDIEAGTYHFSGLTNLGHVYSFGGDHYRQAENPDVNGAKKLFAGAFQSYAVDGNGKLLNKWGLKGYLFGTDDRGANIAERVVAGGRITMTVGAIAVIIEILIGVSIGLLAGFLGGWVDIFLMRVAEVFSSIPLYPFMLILTSLLAQVSLTTDQRLYMIMVILGILGWPGFAYITRAQVLVARESEYVTAAQAMGVKTSRIAFKHILPNIVSVILVNMTLSFAASMQTETSLSFLGFGVNYPQPSWGNMLSRASNAVAAKNFWWQWVFTSGILIMTTVCINTIGDTLRDVMDPKSSNDK
ncbi:MAG: ABC transporter permease subunit [Clostridiales bacterium]|nr:ABC transporter permease subunit [Clostridiales bacterium]